MAGATEKKPNRVKSFSQKPGLIFNITGSSEEINQSSPQISHKLSSKIIHPVSPTSVVPKHKNKIIP